MAISTDRILGMARGIMRLGDEDTTYKAGEGTGH